MKALVMHSVWGCENVPMAGRERAGPDNTEITQVLTRSGNWGHCQDFIIKHEEEGHGHQGKSGGPSNLWG